MYSVRSFWVFSWLDAFNGCNPPAGGGPIHWWSCLTKEPLFAAEHRALVLERRELRKLDSTPTVHVRIPMNFLGGLTRLGRSLQTFCLYDIASMCMCVCGSFVPFCSQAFLICMYAWMCVCMYVCVNVWMCECVNVCTCVCVYMYVNVCKCV